MSPPRALAVIACLMPITVSTGCRSNVEGDAGLLRGSWRTQYVEQHGKELGENGYCRFDGRMLYLYHGKESFSGAFVLHEGTTPKVIDVTLTPGDGSIKSRDGEPLHGSTRSRTDR
jgi:hypothetical protein